VCAQVNSRFNFAAESTTDSYERLFLFLSAGDGFVSQFASNDLFQSDISKRHSRGRFHHWPMAKAELTDAFGHDINQQLLIRNYLSCFLKELSRHMAQRFDGTGGFPSKLENSWRTGAKGGRKIRGEHFKKRAETMRGYPRLVNRF
jgi:hypothetical protein